MRCLVVVPMNQESAMPMTIISAVMDMSHGAVEKVPSSHKLNRYVPHNNHYHESNDKQYCMLIQYIAGG